MALIVIGGATASGKSGLALQIAQEIDAEIISADSMQLYIGADIGTAKVPAAERFGITHHMLDIVPPSFDITANFYQEQARLIADRLTSENRNIVVVGGTGLYIKALMEELDFPARDEAVRNALEREAEEIGAAAMHARLAVADAAAAAVIPSQNLRRVIRALEVVTITGAPYAAALPRTKSIRYPRVGQYAIDVERGELDARIEERVEIMWQDGIEAELDRLIVNGLLQGRTARAAIGYAQILAERDGAGPSAKAATVLATKQYARRQLTWFKREKEISWLSPNIARDQILRDFSSTSAQD